MIYVVRHGNTDWNKNKITMGRRDIPLNELGIKEAYNTSKLLENINFDLIIYSPLIRTRQTADIINKNRNIEIIYDENLIERSLGDLEGKPYSADNSKIWDINTNVSSKNIETMEEFKRRIYDFLEKIENKYNDKSILLVTHGGVSALINTYYNNNLYEGAISDKFLKNCEYAFYNTKKKLPKVKKKY